MQSLIRGHLLMWILLSILIAGLGSFIWLNQPATLNDLAQPTNITPGDQP